MCRAKRISQERRILIFAHIDRSQDHDGPPFDLHVDGIRHRMSIIARLRSMTYGTSVWGIGRHILGSQVFDYWVGSNMPISDLRGRFDSTHVGNGLAGMGR